MRQHNEKHEKDKQKDKVESSKKDKKLLIFLISLRKFGKFISELMTIWGKLTAVFTILFYISAWLFLSKIGAGDLYLQSCSSVNMIAIAVVVAVILALITVAIIYPSLSVVLLTTLPYKDNKIPLELLWAYIAAPIIFMLIFIPSLVYCGDSNLTVMAMGGSLIIIFAIIRFTRIGNRIRDSLMPVGHSKNDSEIHNEKVDMFSIYWGLAISSIISLFTLRFLNELWIYKIDDPKSYLVFFICILLGYVPGGFYIFLRYKQFKVQRLIKFMMFVIILTVCVGIFLVPIKVRTTIFKSIGIYQEEKQMFLLLNTDLKEAIAKKFFTNNTKMKLDKADIDYQLSEFQKESIFLAYTMYYLGNVRLLCKNSFNPDQIKKEDKNELLDYCFAFKPDEVRRIYQTIPKYNKPNFKLTVTQIQWLKNFEETTSMMPIIDNKFNDFKELATYNIEQWQEYSKNANSKITTNIPYDE